MPYSNAMVGRGNEPGRAQFGMASSRFKDLIFQLPRANPSHPRQPRKPWHLYQEKIHVLFKSEGYAVSLYECSS